MCANCIRNMGFEPIYEHSAGAFPMICPHCRKPTVTYGYMSVASISTTNESEETIG